MQTDDGVPHSFNRAGFADGIPEILPNLSCSFVGFIQTNVLHELRKLREDGVPGAHAAGIRGQA